MVKLFHIPIMILFLIFRTLMIILGWVLVPIAAACKAYVKTSDNLGKPNDGPIYHFTWKFMYPWDNFEDGIANKNYWVAPNMFLQVVYWSAIRNPANNLRTVSWLTCKIRPSSVGFYGSFVNRKPSPVNITEFHLKKVIEQYDTPVVQWFYCYQGLYSNFYWQFMFRGYLRRFWIGWKIMPKDIFGVPETSHRYNGAGFAIQMKRVHT